MELKCKRDFNHVFKIVFKWKTEGTINRHLIFQKGSDCWEHQLFKIWNCCCFVVTISKCFYENQEYCLFTFDALSKSMNAYSKEEEFINKNSGKFGKHIFLSPRNLILNGSLIWLDNKLLQEIMILPEIFQ